MAKHRIERWLEMARDAYAASRKMRDPDAKRTMLEIAASYEWLAERIEELESEKMDED